MWPGSPDRHQLPAAPPGRGQLHDEELCVGGGGGPDPGRAERGGEPGERHAGSAL